MTGCAFPSKDEVADYLEAYAARFGSRYQSGVRVDRAPIREGGRSIASVAGDHRWESNNVVIATGGCQQRRRSREFAARAAAAISPSSTPAATATRPSSRPVRSLVVGVGNSGCRDRPRAQLGTTRSRSQGTPSAESLPPWPNVGPLRFARLSASSGSTYSTWARQSGGGSCDAGRAGGSAHRHEGQDLVAAGVSLVPRVTGVRDGRPELADGRVCEVASVIWCTGSATISTGWSLLRSMRRAGPARTAALSDRSRDCTSSGRSASSRRCRRPSPESAGMPPTWPASSTPERARQSLGMKRRGNHNGPSSPPAERARPAGSGRRAGGRRRPRHRPARMPGPPALHRVAGLALVAMGCTVILMALTSGGGAPLARSRWNDRNRW